MTQAIDTSDPRAKAIVEDFLRPFPHFAIGEKSDTMHVDLERRMILFPDYVIDSSQGPDMELTLHEIGHVIDMPAHRCVRSFDFRVGVPILSGFGVEYESTTPYSAFTESRAFAWEAVLRRDLLGIAPDFPEMADALRYTSDFWLYDGRSTEAKLDWAAGLISEAYSKIGGLDEVRANLQAKNDAMPIEMARRMKIDAAVPDDFSTVRKTRLGDWSVSTQMLSLTPNDDIFLVSCSSDDVLETFEYRTRSGAQRFHDKILEANACLAANPMAVPVA